MNSVIRNWIVASIALALLCAPLSALAFSWTFGLVPCGNGTPTQLQATASETGAPPADNTHSCGFFDFVNLVNNGVNGLIILSIFLAAGIFIWIGFTFMTAGDSSGKRDQAKKTAKNLVLGLLIVLSAWLIVHFVTSILLDPSVNIFMSNTPTTP